MNLTFSFTCIRNVTFILHTFQMDGQECWMDIATSQMQILESSPDPIDLQHKSGLSFLECRKEVDKNSEED